MKNVSRLLLALIALAATASSTAFAVEHTRPVAVANDPEGDPTETW